MTRAPRPGATKTRLAPLLGHDGCARLHRALLEHTVAAAAAAVGARRVVVAVDPPGHLDTVGALVRLVAPGAELIAQTGDDLGGRMAAASAAAYSRHGGPAATGSGSTAWVTVAFVVANGVGTAAWTSAYPTFTELFPTHLRGIGVGTSVAVGRIGAIVGTLALPSLATTLGATASYLLVAGFWLAGAAGAAVTARRTTVDRARRPLEEITPAAVAAPAAA